MNVFNVLSCRAISRTPYNYCRYNIYSEDLFNLLKFIIRLDAIIFGGCRICYRIRENVGIYF